MAKKLTIISVVLFASSLLVACGTDKETKNIEMEKVTIIEKTAENTSTMGKKVDGRWYSSAQLLRGKKDFADYCAVCHGDKGQGLVADWKKSDATGKFPAPPLNGTAHTWHHSKQLLMRTVNEGGIALGGSMPPFKDKLTDNEKEAVLAYVMSLWPKEIYEVWQKRNPVTK